MMDVGAFDRSANIANFRPIRSASWDEACSQAHQDCRRGHFAWVVPARWEPPGKTPVDVMLKLMIGETADGDGGSTPRPKFDTEVEVLEKVHRERQLEWRGPGRLPARIAGLAHLTISPCAGWEEDAALILPHAKSGAPLYFIAMEPLTNGTLWKRLRDAAGPLCHENATRAAADLLSALAALHALNFAHGDLK